mgnify:FL=1
MEFSILYRWKLDQLSGNVQVHVTELINQVSSMFFSIFYFKNSFYFIQKYCRELEEVVIDGVFNSLSLETRPTVRQCSGACHGVDQSGE